MFDVQLLCVSRSGETGSTSPGGNSLWETGRSLGLLEGESVCTLPAVSLPGLWRHWSSEAHLRLSSQAIHKREITFQSKRLCSLDSYSRYINTTLISSLAHIRILKMLFSVHGGLQRDLAWETEGVGSNAEPFPST